MVEKTIEDWIWFYYKDCGFSIIPLKEHDKKPNITSWEKYHKERPTEEEIQQWIKDGLFQNIAVICGHVSNNLVAIDIDDEKIPEEIGLKWEKINQTGWAIRTGKGYQIWIRHHSNPGQLKKFLKYCVEYRSNGGYVAAPPSIHPNGNQYHFIDKKDFTEVKPLDVIDAKSIFEELKKKIGEKRNIIEQDKNISYSKKNETLENGYPKCVEIALNSIAKKGMRYYTLYGIASSFAMRRIPKDMAMKRIKQFNMEKCVPSHENNIVEQAVNGAYLPDAHRYGCEFWMDQAELCPYENVMECQYGRKKEKRDLAKQYGIFEWEERTNKTTGEKYYTIVNVFPIKLAKLILNEFDYNFITIKDNKDIYYYNGGIYHDNGETLISEIAQDFMEEQTTKHRIEEVVSYIKNNNYYDRKLFDTNIDIIGVENGVYQIKTKELTDYKPEYYLTSIIPIKYDKEAKCPQWIQFLQDVCYLEDIPFLQEIIGYCFYRRYVWAILVILVGYGRNGKTTFINAITQLLGDDNVTHLPLQLLAHDTFAKSKLYHKWANLCADIGQEEIKRTGIIKELTGGDPQYARDLYKTGFNFINYAKLIFAANVLPECKDNTFAMKERFAIIEFPNKFPRGSPECDPYIGDKIITELPGIFNWAMEGLERLITNKNFSPYRDLEEVTKYKAEERNPIRQFITQYLIYKEGEEIVKDVLYRTYLKFAHDNKYPSIASNFFSSQLKQHIPHDWVLDDGQPRSSGHKTVWRGIAFKSDVVIEDGGKDGKDRNQKLSL